VWPAGILAARSEQTEVLDGPMPPEERAAELRDIDRLNAWFAGYALSLRHVAARLGASPSRGRRTVVDVGGGGARFAVRLTRWAWGRGHDVRVIVVERDDDALAVARTVSFRNPGIMLVQADAHQLPFRTGGVDLVTSTLLLHHLPSTEVAACLREMRRAARVGVIVNDLLRTPLALLLVWVGTRLFASSRAARVDGPLSVRRAYSETELRGLASEAGLTELTVHRYPWVARLIAVA
jgi:ubiquinone/menaquinone biosynthesis C-methylase UbiE